MYSRSGINHRRPLPAYDDGTEHVGFSTTRKTCRAPSTSTKRGEVFGGSAAIATPFR